MTPEMLKNQDYVVVGRDWFLQNTPKAKPRCPRRLDFCFDVFELDPETLGFRLSVKQKNVSIVKI